MWKLVSTFNRLWQKPHCFKAVHIRSFLSDSFKLEKAWNDRLSSPILKKINVNDMFYELDHQFQHYANASSLDIDIFVNAVDDDSNFDEVEDIVHKLRLSPEALNILPSTHHALIRLYIKNKKTKDLIRILDDRLNYGIFLDDYCSLLMMDTLIKEGNFRDAAKVSTFCMLQEDFSNPILKYMSLYACHKYLENPVPWNEAEDVSEESKDDDDDEVKVRVRFIRNPFFDEHFDLVDPNHLLGKTLQFIGTEIDDCVGRTYKLIGLVLSSKLDQAKDFLQELTLKENKVLVNDGIKLILQIMGERLKNESKESSLMVHSIDEIKHLLDKFTDSQLVTESNLLTLVEDTLMELVRKNEPLESNKQLQIYKNWEETRETLLKEQIAEITREKQLAEIKRQKQILQEKEEELFFFDNEDKLDLIIEEKEKRKEEQRERERIKLEKIKKKEEVTKKKKRIEPEEPPLDGFIDDNIPMKLINTKL